MPQTIASRDGVQAPALYLAPLDGLRFFAFLSVFIHHLAPLKTAYPMAVMQQVGWAGVDLFLAISSYLFFHLLSAEHAKTGTINIGWFYVRRMLRIYPLMMLFPLAMLLIYGSRDGLGYLRLAGLGLFLDNAITWFKGYNVSIPFSTHLWTLSYEFQFYLFLPFIFLACKRYGNRAFLAGVLVFFAYCFVARMVVYAVGARHPLIWVTPFLRPESILIGMSLVVVRPRWHWGFSAAAAVLAGGAFAMMPLPWTSPVASAVSYPLIALMAGGILDTATRANWLSKALSVRPLTILGRISFGLYVYHVLAIHLGLTLLRRYAPAHLNMSADGGDYALYFTVTLVTTVMLSLASYWLFEHWFDGLKLRFAVVVGRL